MSHKGFNQGASHLPTDINATEYPPLLWHILVNLGLHDPAVGGGKVLPMEAAKKVAQLIRRVLHLHGALWKKVHTERELTVLLPKVIEE
jgi:hypothetical protein